MSTGKNLQSAKDRSICYDCKKPFLNGQIGHFVLNKQTDKFDVLCENCYQQLITGYETV